MVKRTETKCRDCMHNDGNCVIAVVGSKACNKKYQPGFVLDKKPNGKNLPEQIILPLPRRGQKILEEKTAFSMQNPDYADKVNAIRTGVARVLSENIAAHKEKEGMKFDDGKRDWTLLFDDLTPQLEEVVKVLEHGAEKYARDNWKKVSIHRYQKALLRHITAYASGEQNDPDTGLHHLAHAMCCSLFLMHGGSDGRPYA